MSAKEILDFKEDADYKRLSVDEIVILRDYITNLQKEVRINNDLIPYLKNKEKSLKKQITNLQEENERLKEINKEQANHLISKNNLSYEDYKSRIDKANEIIDEVLFVGVKNYRSQLEIIQKVINGGDDNE